MAQHICVYLTDLHSVNAAIGSGDRELVERIIAEQTDEIYGIDDLFETAEEHGPGLTAAEALTELVRGELTYDPLASDEIRGLYQRVFITLCLQYGAWLIDDRLSRCDMDWLNRLDATLQAAAVPLRLHELWSRPNVVSHPQIEQLLEVGYWTAEEAAKAISPLEHLVARMQLGEEREALEAVAQWCRQSQEYPDCTLVGEFG